MAYTRFELGQILETDYEQTVARALDRITTVSNGALADFDAHSPVTALVEGLTFVAQELRAAANEVPLNTLLRILDTYGAGLNAGSPAVGEVEITLAAPAYTNISVPAGWLLAGGGLEFETTEPLTFFPGQIASSVPIKCTQIGAGGNLAAGLVNGVSSRSAVFAPVASVKNISKLTGGSNPESQLDAIYRCSKFLHYRDVLVTKPQYEIFVEDLLGSGSKAIARPNPDERSNIQVFAILPDGSEPSPTQLNLIQREAEQHIPLGTSVSILAMPVVYITMRIIAKLEIYADPTAAFNALRVSLENYFSPGNWGGSTVRYKEIEHLARMVPGVLYVQGAYLYRDSETSAAAVPAYLLNAADIPLENSHTLPRLTYVGVDFVTDFTTYTYDFNALPFEPEPR
jgi:hypothetical protein